MRTVVNWFSVLCCLSFAQVALAQNMPCDEIVNTGETGCIYEIVGQDFCPERETNECPSDCSLFYFPPPLAGWEITCMKDQQPQWFGYVDYNVNTSAPKWSAPPPGESGNVADIPSAIACGKHYRCDCQFDEEAQKVRCFKDQCGLSILWTLAKDPQLHCYTSELP